jgi:hypothetical protein
MKSLSTPFQERKGQWKACIGIEALSLPINLVIMSIAFPASSHEYFLSILNYKIEYQNKMFSSLFIRCIVQYFYGLFFFWKTSRSIDDQQCFYSPFFLGQEKEN